MYAIAETRSLPLLSFSIPRTDVVTRTSGDRRSEPWDGVVSSRYQEARDREKGRTQGKSLLLSRRELRISNGRQEDVGGRRSSNNSVGKGGGGSSREDASFEPKALGAFLVIVFVDGGIECDAMGSGRETMQSHKCQYFNITYPEKTGSSLHQLSSAQLVREKQRKQTDRRSKQDQNLGVSQ